jgi:hypothetical protein
VHFLDSSFLLFSRKLLQGRKHDLGHFSGGLLLPGEFGCYRHFVMIPSQIRSLPLSFNAAQFL